MDASTLEELAGTRWAGSNHVWLDPDGAPQVSEGEIAFQDGVIRYTWAWEGKPQSGVVEWTRDGDHLEASWTDTWHQLRPMRCLGAVGASPLLSMSGRYAAPEGPPWGWRTMISLRPSGELVLQMFNLCPWGEEQRAVQLVGVRLE